MTEEHGEEITERAQRNEEVETSDGTARAEDMLEEQAGGYLCRVLELRLRNCEYKVSVLLWDFRVSAEPTSCKICNICQLIQSGDDEQRDERMNPNRLHRVLC